MGFRDKIKSMKEDLVETTQESIDRGEDRPDYGSIFIKDKIPEGVRFWKPEPGEHLLDVIPFESAGLDPRGKKAGKWTYLVDVWVHRNVGSMFDDFVCQVRAFKEPDPMCEYTRMSDLDTDKWKEIAPKRRTVYLIWSHDSPEEEALGLQIWEVAHWNFEKHLSKIAKNPRGGAPIPFSHVVDGKSIAFEIVKSGTWTDAQGKDHDSYDFVGHRFVEREEEIPDEFGDAIFSLDECIKFRPTWEEQKKAFPLEADSNGSSPAPSEDKQTDDTPIDDEPDTTPEPEEKPKKKSKKTKLECPGGGTIGVDLETLDACKKCEVWDPCSDIADKLKKKEPKEEPPKPPEKKKIMRRRRRISS